MALIPWNGNVSNNQCLSIINPIIWMPFFKAGRKAGQEQVMSNGIRFQNKLSNEIALFLAITNFCIKKPDKHCLSGLNLLVFKKAYFFFLLSSPSICSFN